MTDVMVQDLLKDVRVRIKCREVVKKLAIYKDCLAVSDDEIFRAICRLVCITCLLQCIKGQKHTRQTHMLLCS